MSEHAHDVLQNNLFYAKTNLTLAEMLRSDEALAHLEFNYTSLNIEEFMHSWHYQHRVSPWPCIIDDQHVERMNALVRAIPHVVYKALKIKLEQDHESFCDYMNVSPLVAEIFNRYVLDPVELPIRYDAVVCDQTFKLVEINCGASLGGWQMDYLQLEVRNSLLKSAVSAEWNVKHRSICESTIRSLIQIIVKNKGKSAKGNILFFLPDASSADKYTGRTNFHELHEQLSRPFYPDGRMVFVADLNEVEISADGLIRCGGEVMDAVLLTTEKGDEISDEFYGRIQAAYQGGGFYYPDNTNFMLMGNKLVFPLLYEPNVFSQLTPTEQRLVKDHIPWSAKLSGETVSREGVEYNVVEYLEDHKEDLVLKKGFSMQGKDVIVGRSVSLSDWRSSIAQYRGDSDWLIQAFCAPDPVYAADGDRGVGVFKMVWGFFATAGRYGGCFLRGVPDASSENVINSAAGATEFLVFEEQALPKRMVI